MIVSIWQIKTQDAWLAEFMGLQAVGLMVLEKIFFKVFPILNQ